MWINAILFFGGWGGVALILSLRPGDTAAPIATLAGAFGLGLALLGALIWHLRRLSRQARARLVFDPETVSLSAPGHVVNFGMIDAMLWSRDFLNDDAPAGERPGRHLIRVLYRSGDRLDQGAARAFTFAARATRAEMAALQRAYLVMMWIVKSDRTQRRRALEVLNGTPQDGPQDPGARERLLAAVGAALSPDLSGANGADDPRDRIAMILPDRPAPVMNGAAGAVFRGLVSRLVIGVSTIWIAAGALLFSAINLAFLIALL